MLRVNANAIELANLFLIALILNSAVVAVVEANKVQAEQGPSTMSNDHPSRHPWRPGS